MSNKPNTSLWKAFYFSVLENSVKILKCWFNLKVWLSVKYFLLLSQVHRKIH